MPENNMNGKDFLLGAVIGGLLGAVTALLLAPKSGRELRVDISDKYADVSEKTAELASTVSSRGRVLANSVTQKGQALASNLGHKSQELASNVSQKSQELASNVSQKGQAIVSNVNAHAADWAGKALEVVGTVAEEVKLWSESRKEALGTVEGQTGKVNGSTNSEE